MSSPQLVEQPVGLAYSPLGHQYKREYRTKKRQNSPVYRFWR